MKTCRVRAFTLIELLIVVAIIAILAAIAVPNFLEAQVRSKISRSRSDQRAIAVAIESYRSDNTSYPDWYQATGFDYYAGDYINGPCLSTPIAYLTSWHGISQDPFGNPLDPRQGWLKGEYLYHSNAMCANVRKGAYGGGDWGVPEGWLSRPTDHTDGGGGFDLLGALPQHEWAVAGAGPDRELWVNNSADVMYDSSNGTVSRGDVARFGP